MAGEINRDPDLEWLDHVRPVGLVVAPSLLKELGLSPLRQGPVETATVAELIDDDESKPDLCNLWAFVQRVLGWEARLVAGAPGGPSIPDDLLVALPEHGTTLAPTWAVAERGEGEPRWQLLVRIEATGVDADARASLDGWEATPHQRFERLLRDTGVFAGVLMTERAERIGEDTAYRPELRLIYAPRGETSGYLAFPLRPLATVAGRPMLGGLKLLLDSAALFTNEPAHRLSALLKKSREAQAAVSSALAEQVLGALHELLRGLDAAEPKLIRELARLRPDHLYEGLLGVLMRLVFILYAEDRDLLPSRGDVRARDIYEMSYSVRGLYARLVEDAALNPDTMDERRGGWGRLLALFRLVHKGHANGFVRARGGKLFDPDEFPFLEGLASKEEIPRIVGVSDGCVLRILEGLMTLKLRGGARERLSYRALDVEQIGSVYETVMGFTAELSSGPVLAIKAGKHNRTPVFVDLEKLLEAKAKERTRFLKDETERSISVSQTKPVETATSVDDLAAALENIADERGSPRKRILPAGTPILQPTDERRRTGSHYTPRSLTAPIVKYALEPAFQRLGEGATPEQILDLKVCDPAMGSGAFLVEACRTIGERLVQAWDRHGEKKPAIPPDEDEQLHARRLVAQRCLYGVDRNPRAVDLARLSLWLTTLAKDHEFTFLDHALKCGDSLVGLSKTQIAATHWDTSKPPTFVGKLVSDHLRDAEELRARIRAEAEGATEAQLRPLLRRADAKVAAARIIGDGVIAAFFSADKPKKRIERLVEFQKEVLSHISSTRWSEYLSAFGTILRTGDRPVFPFHWEIEFPEVFARENPGFDAIIGNPPFLGGKRISGSLGGLFAKWLGTLHEGASGNTDLVAHFFRRAFHLLRSGGAFGLIATKTIAQGDTRRGGLAWIGNHGGEIINARRRIAWPGEAAVTVSSIVLTCGHTRVSRYLDGKAVNFISAFLFPSGSHSDPNRLASNSKRAFIGCDIKGQGFLFADDDPDATPLSTMESLVALEVDTAERIRPYIGGDELLTSPKQASHRWVIDFDRLTELEARKWPALMQIVEQKVKPERATKAPDLAAWPWWQFWRTREALRNACKGLKEVLAIAQTGDVLGFAFVSLPMIFSHTVVIFPTDARPFFAVVQARLHELWTRFYAATMKEDARYIPRDCFETFPLPNTVGCSPELQLIGQTYYDHRAALLVARNEGLTKTYNRFHDRGERSEDIRRLRQLHAEMDCAVLEAYRWHDLAIRAEPIFLDETNEDDHTYQGRLFWRSDFRDEVLARLLALNAERHAEEVRLGIAPGMKREEQEDDEDELEEA